MRSLVEASEERGYIEPAELEAFGVELDLSDEELAELKLELEALGHEFAPPGPARDEPDEVDLTVEPVIGAGDSLQLFLADVGRHKLLKIGRASCREKV